jgi:hypothetical protein
VAAAAALAHGARGLPARELVVAPGMLMGVVMAAVGLVLVVAVRRVPTRA